MEADRLLGDLRAIIEVSRAMAGERDLDRLLALILGAVRDLARAERASLFIVDHERGELWTRIAQQAGEIRLPLGSGLAGTVATTGMPINIPDAYADPRFNPEHDRSSGFCTRSLLSLPLRNHQGQIVGVLQVLNKKDGRAFDAYDEDILSALAAQAAVAIDTAQLIQRDLDRQRMARELELARTIQLALLPASPPELPGWRMSGFCRSCDETGGDYYDFIPVPGDGVDAVIGDISGHGIAAALMMSTARAFLRALHSQERDPARLVSRLNDLLESDMAADAFMSLALCRCSGDGTVQVVLAGHEPPLIHRSGKGFDAPCEGGPLLSLVSGLNFRPATVPALAPGDLLVLATDGITEAHRRPGQALFGTERLRRVVAEAAPGGALAVCQAVAAAVDDHLGDQTPHDDMTLAVVERTA